jgi:hypothetical protein
MEDSRSPLKDRPLRTPGQSCDERRRQIFDDKLELPIIAASAATVLTGLEVWRTYSNQPPQPWIYALFAFVTIAILGLRIRRFVPEMRQLQLAADGEKAVGQFVEKLRVDGYEVFHDIPAESFNVDHVVVGHTGIFTVETKTWRKPHRGDAQIKFDGERLTVAGFTPDRDPVAQARAQATWIARLVEEGTGRRYAVKPVVLFPGWWVEQGPTATREMWILEPKALPQFLENEPSRLKPEDVKLVAYHISRYVRTFERA